MRFVPVAGAAVYLKPHPRNPVPDPIAVQKRITAADGGFEFDGAPIAMFQIKLDKHEAKCIFGATPNTVPGSS